jgi:hypothetical protein
MSIIGSKNWKATEGTDFGGNDRKLVVTGDVELSRSNERPRLSEAVPQGINPKILILILSAEACGDVGADVITCEPVSFEKEISEDQYSQVDIRGQATVDVEKIIS